MDSYTQTPEGAPPSRCWENADDRSGKIVVVNESGPPCPRCKQSTQVREHKEIGKRQLDAKFYFARWYLCTNRHCWTTLIMPEAFKAWNYGRVVWGETWDDVDGETAAITTPTVMTRGPHGGSTTGGL